MGGETGTPSEPGVDGKVRISPGEFYLTVNKKDETGNVTQSRINGLRPSNVFHELTESYGRTTLKMPYMRADRSGAHQYAIDKEGKSFSNLSPGGFSGFIPSKTK